MGWIQFLDIIDTTGVDLDDWSRAVDGNPNTPEDALRTAILTQIIDTDDMARLDRLCVAVIDLVRQAINLIDDNSVDYRRRVDCRRELMQMSADTPGLSPALIALGYDKDGLPRFDRKQ